MGLREPPVPAHTSAQQGSAALSEPGGAAGSRAAVCPAPGARCGVGLQPPPTDTEGRSRCARDAAPGLQFSQPPCRWDERESPMGPLGQLLAHIPHTTSSGRDAFVCWEPHAVLTSLPAPKPVCKNPLQGQLCRGDPMHCPTDEGSSCSLPCTDWLEDRNQRQTPAGTHSASAPSEQRPPEAQRSPEGRRHSVPQESAAPTASACQHPTTGSWAPRAPPIPFQPSAACCCQQSSLRRGSPAPGDPQRHRPPALLFNFPAIHSADRGTVRPVRVYQRQRANKQSSAQPERSCWGGAALCSAAQTRRAERNGKAPCSPGRWKEAIPKPPPRQSHALRATSVHRTACTTWRSLTALLHDGCRRGSDALLGRQTHTQRPQLRSLPRVQLWHWIAV